VLNIDPRAPQSEAYIKISGAAGLVRELIRHACNDWTFHVHTNGHNAKSWTISFTCGLAAQFGQGAWLTLHSGMAPSYIRNSPAPLRSLMRMACVLYRRIICVNAEIAEAVAGLGIPQAQIRIAPAFLPVEAPLVAASAEIESWLQGHTPIVTSTMFFRPEYGFEVLMQAAKRLRVLYPRIGCLVMGCGDGREPAAELIAKHGLKDVMLLAGDLDHPLCLSLMARSAVFARPTLRDGDSISVREAVALGIPVVASNVGTRPEGVLLFEPGDVDGLVGQVERAINRQKI
jgi:glycosyltransferase involved in cell wall biosynthesis